MLGNCENVVFISPTNNEWPQNLQQIDEKNLMASTNSLMEKSSQEKLLQQPPQQQQPLKCPRCDSSNTKFCYYNNYSLSQPRHFCKTCKRYWTRGGTLRNVPVGGGCRKNKRVKRPASALETTTSVTSANPKTPSQTQVNVVSSAPNHVNPLLYGFSGNPSEVNLSYPGSGRYNSRVSSNMDTLSGYDIQPQLNALALGFSSGLLTSDSNGLNQIQELVSSNSLLSSYSTFGSSSSTTSSSPAMASLLGTSLHQQKFTNEGVKHGRAPDHFQNLTAFEVLQMRGTSESEIIMKQEKTEQGHDWNLPCHNQIEQTSFSSDPSIYWNSAGAWHDQPNIGSSLTSLIFNS